MDEFRRHLDQQKCGELPAQEQKYQIYNVKMCLGWIKGSQDNNILSMVQDFAVDGLSERALELVKEEWLNDPWGHF